MSESKVTLKLNFSGTLFSDFSSYDDSFASYCDRDYSNIKKWGKGGGSPFYETFSQNRFFLNDGFPKGGLPKKTVFFGNFSQNGGGSSGRAFLSLYNPSHKIES